MAGGGRVLLVTLSDSFEGSQIYKEEVMTREYWANFALCIVLGTLVIFAITKASSALTPKGLFVDDPKPSQTAQEMMQEVVLTKYQLSESQKNMVEADFYVQNKSAQSIKNIQILCEFFDSNGMYRDRKTWLLAETVPSMHALKISSVTKRFVNTGAEALNCNISDFQVVKKSAFSLERHVSKGHGQASEEGHGQKAPAGH